MTDRIWGKTPTKLKKQHTASQGHNSRTQRLRFFRRFAWLFVLVGLAGNLLFFVGSICFLFQTYKEFGIWLFITGSCLMLVSSSAGALDEYSQSESKC